ncbi:ferredoxin domain-containing protein [Archaeoglobus sp.]
MILNEKEFKNKGIRIAAYLIAESARTAPKSKGEDVIEIIYVDGEDLERIAAKMEEIASDGDKDFVRDAESLRKSQAVLLLGAKGDNTVGVNCGACGYKSCAEFKKAERKGENFIGPNCAFRLLDLGIALGSAVKLSAILGVDTRIMYRIGIAAKKLGMIDADVVMGIPISALGKSPYFDRMSKK